MYKYSVELYINNKWIIEYRYYNIIKNLNDFDLRNCNNRRNAKLIK